MNDYLIIFCDGNMIERSASDIKELIDDLITDLDNEHIISEVVQVTKLNS